METNETNNLKKSITFGDWVPKKLVQDFFNYGNTKMSTFSSDYNIKTAKVGKRIFYKYSDVLRLIEESITD
jgi:hypothetical protein